MRMSVDKARRQRQPIGIDIPVRLIDAKVADREDTVTFNGHIGLEPRLAQTIEHRGIADDQIAA